MNLFKSLKRPEKHPSKEDSFPLRQERGPKKALGVSAPFSGTINSPCGTAVSQPWGWPSQNLIPRKVTLSTGSAHPSGTQAQVPVLGTGFEIHDPGQDQHSTRKQGKCRTSPREKASCSHCQAYCFLQRTSTPLKSEVWIDRLDQASVDQETETYPNSQQCFFF